MRITNNNGAGQSHLQSEYSLIRGASDAKNHVPTKSKIGIIQNTEKSVIFHHKFLI